MFIALRKQEKGVVLAEIGGSRLKGTLTRPLLSIGYKSFIIKQIKANSNLQKKVRFSLWIIQDGQEVVLRLDFSENSENLEETMWNRPIREK